jgi:hypothetical protein
VGKENVKYKVYKFFTKRKNPIFNFILNERMRGLAEMGFAAVYFQDVLNVFEQNL